LDHLRPPPYTSEVDTSEFRCDVSDDDSGNVSNDASANVLHGDDRRIHRVRPLISPARLIEALPVSPHTRHLVAHTRTAIADILHGRDDRLLIVVGPCSIHDHDQAMQYAALLACTAQQLSEDLLIIMRVYFEKPRTTVGWKGYINDPRLDGSYRINEGLRRARTLLIEIARLGLPTATEFLDLLSPQFIADLIAWGAIGARTTESQSHRQLSSGLSCPLGFKNSTHGSIQIAADAMVAARVKHAFMGITKMGMAAIFETRGHDDTHVILRGGKHGPNYDAASINACCDRLAQAGLRPQVMVDCAHANANKRHTRQIIVAADVAQQIAQGDARIIGVMIESHLEEGRQDLQPGRALRPGVSITDPCLGWLQTEAVLQQLARAVRQRRGHHAASLHTRAP
jgi:3-deoxy-7-phosphoheptulonate synthase